MKRYPPLEHLGKEETTGLFFRGQVRRADFKAFMISGVVIRQNFADIILIDFR